MEALKHECGVALIRLLKPLEFYQQKYGTWMYGLHKLYLLMEKQHNRGQEGAGLVSVKLEPKPGEEYMFRERAVGTGAITEIFDLVHRKFADNKPQERQDPIFAKKHIPFAGELYMGHLRYSTTGKSGITYIHPFLRRNNWRANNLALCGNFNLTNVDAIFDEITSTGQHPRQYSDTYIMLEQMGHKLDREAERLYRMQVNKGLKGLEITRAIEEELDLTNVLKKCAPQWDGGYVICGLTGSGESFALRDPWGIRTAFFYADDEVVVLASERPVIQTTLNVKADDIQELKPGQALIIHRSGRWELSSIIPQKALKACSFERIYFSRGSDLDIYRERKNLGKSLVEPILKTVEYDLAHTVFSFIPNTAEVAYYGLLEGLNEYLNEEKSRRILSHDLSLTDEALQEILSRRIRSEKVAVKDIKLRTFIAEGNTRDDLAAHVYDITYGSIQAGQDKLVVIDDSIVRGTTLKQSIIGILDRLQPQKIVIVSSSPQVRYPDCYGIDMSKMTEFIAFKAAIALLRERGMDNIIDDTYQKAKQQQSLSLAEGEYHHINYVKNIYAPFSNEEISAKIAQLLTPKGIRAQVSIVYQDLEGLHRSCPQHAGDWYFSGDYPTVGGSRFVNNAFIRYIEEQQ
ncbi:MAG: amidophosphoribosyltransferase [Bacteroidales bacterium]|jgi:amidophosphoribosyltransferase